MENVNSGEKIKVEYVNEFNCFNSYKYKTEAYKTMGLKFKNIGSGFSMPAKNIPYEITKENKELINDMIEYFMCSNNYKKNLNIGQWIGGPKGVGKSTIMKSFGKLMDIPVNQTLPIFSHRRFINVGIAELINYYRTHNNIDFFTFNTGKDGYKPNPKNICLHDIHLLLNKSYGSSVLEILSEFFLARYDILQDYQKVTHITTNAEISKLEILTKDDKTGATWSVILNRFEEMFNFNILNGKCYR